MLGAAGKTPHMELGKGGAVRQENDPHDRYERTFSTMRQAIFAMLGVVGLAVALAACGGNAETGRPPIVNSGSYDWRDAFIGPNGYPLPGYEGYFKIPQ